MTRENLLWYRAILTTLSDFSKVLVTLFELGVPFQVGEEGRTVFRRTE
jgi:hypothetical protein